ncbi:hypothetical protein KC19_11G130700 [Ceratodon purpureus]|uniref:Uncharacterized protein n=1 Tax=Ceratodon purpureus TaxID=3225 RepID=A0A8T0GEJ5_CERPU|nr:hypothetical protein KC19_11G130700 [Ceratodon purpureus]
MIVDQLGSEPWHSTRATAFRTPCLFLSGGTARTLVCPLSILLLHLLCQLCGLRLLSPGSPLLCLLRLLRVHRPVHLDVFIVIVQVAAVHADPQRQHHHLDDTRHKHHRAQHPQERRRHARVIKWLVKRAPNLRRPEEDGERRRKQSDHGERQQHQLQSEAPASRARAQTYQPRSDRERAGDHNQPCRPARLVLDNEQQHNRRNSSGKNKQVQDQEQRRRAHGNVPLEASSGHGCSPSTQYIRVEARGRREVPGRGMGRWRCGRRVTGLRVASEARLQQRLS